MTLEFPYDLSLSPPFHVIPVVLESPGAGIRIDVHGELDTGSPITYIRAETVRRLQLRRSGRVRTQGVTDSPSDDVLVSFQYNAALTIGSLFDAIVALAELPDNHIDTELLIGRDIINQLYIGFWGPELVGNIYQERPDRI